MYLGNSVCLNECGFGCTYVCVGAREREGVKVFDTIERR